MIGLFCIKCKKHFFPAKGSSRDVVYFNYVCVTVGSVEPESCDDSFFKLHDGQSNILPDVSVEQFCLFCENIIHVMEHQKYMAVPLQIDTLPCDIRVDDILTALMRLLPWVSLYIGTYFTS